MSLENPHINIFKQLIPLEDAIQQRRIHPVRAAKNYLLGATLPTSCPFDAKSTTSSSRELTDEEREEKLGLEGIVIDWMVHDANRMRENRPPYGLVYSDDGFNGDSSDKNMRIVKDANLFGDPYTTFSVALYHTLANSLDRKLEHIFTIPQGREAETYRRYMEFVNRNGLKPDDPYGIKHTVSFSNTALRMMGDILANSRDIDSTPLGRKPTIDESANASRNSTPIILKLSSYEQTVFDTIHRSMTEGGKIWKSLTIVEDKGKMYYQIKDTVLQRAIDQLSHPDTKEKAEGMSRGGCPARLRFDGKESAIETLWNWYIDYAVKVAKQTPTISR